MLKALRRLPPLPSLERRDEATERPLEQDLDGLGVFGRVRLESLYGGQSAGWIFFLSFWIAWPIRRRRSAKKRSSSS